MNSEYLKNYNTSKLEYVFYCVSLLILLTISRIDTNSYEFIIIIIRSALSLLIIILMKNNISDRNKFIRLIGLGYVISNIVDILGIIFINQNTNIYRINILSSSLETIIFLLAIKGLAKKNLYNTFGFKKIIKFIFIFVFLILFLMINYYHNNLNFISISNLSIIYFFNLIILLFGYHLMDKYKKSQGINNFNLIDKLLISKILFFVIGFMVTIINKKLKIINITLDILSVIQIFLVYKLIIQNALINPYIKTKSLNDQIIKSTKNQEEINYLLKRINYIEDKIEERLVYEDEFFKSIISSTPNGWLIFNKNLDLVYCNNSFKKIINCQDDDVLGAIKENIIDYSKFRDNIIKSQTKKIKIEDSIRTIDKKIYKCIYMSYKNDNECICFMFEITKEVNILDNLINLKKEYEDLIRNIKTPVFICDGYNNIVDFSKSYELTFDKYKTYISEDNKKLNLEGFFNIIHPDDKEIVRYVFKINQEAKSNNELYNHGVFRFRIINKNREIIWLESKTTIYYEGDTKYKIVNYVDISEYIESKKNLERNQDMYKGVLDSIPEGIYLEDIDNEEYIFVNDKFKEIFSYKIKDINQKIYKNEAMKVHPEYSHVLYKGIENIKHDKISEFDDIKYIDSNGKIIDAKVGSVPFKINNNIFKLSVIKTMEDIKNIEKLKNKIIERDKHDKMKMEFFVNMSHELKTPLNLIFTSTQLIESLYNKNKLSGESIKNHINLTKQNSYRLLKIINDLIEFTRMETGFYHVNLINKDIILVIEDIVMSVVDYAKSKGVQIIFDTDIEELTMAIDVNALEIIVLNLLSNAIKFTDKDGYIYVNMIYKEDENKIDIRIEDTGIGIEEDKLNLIFKRFNNVNKGFVGNINGSGIGLSMIKSLSNLINAKISVKSEYGKGSIFTISLNISHKKEDDRNSNYKVKKNEPLNVERLVVGMEDIYNV